MIETLHGRKVRDRKVTPDRVNYVKPAQNAIPSSNVYVIERFRDRKVSWWKSFVIESFHESKVS